MPGIDDEKELGADGQIKGETVDGQAASLPKPGFNITAKRRDSTSSSITSDTDMEFADEGGDRASNARSEILDGDGLLDSNTAQNPPLPSSRSSSPFGSRKNSSASAASVQSSGFNKTQVSQSSLSPSARTSSISGDDVGSADSESVGSTEKQDARVLEIGTTLNMEDAVDAQSIKGSSERSMSSTRSSSLPSTRTGIAQGLNTPSSRLSISSLKDSIFDDVGKTSEERIKAWVRQEEQAQIAQEDIELTLETETPEPAAEKRTGVSRGRDLKLDQTPKPDQGSKPVPPLLLKSAPTPGTKNFTAYVSNLSTQDGKPKKYPDLLKTSDPTTESLEKTTQTSIDPMKWLGKKLNSGYKPEMDEGKVKSEKNNRFIVDDKKIYKKYEIKNKVYDQVLSKGKIIPIENGFAINNDDGGQELYKVTKPSDQSNQSLLFTCKTDAAQILTESKDDKAKRKNLYQSILNPANKKMDDIDLDALPPAKKHMVIGLLQGKKALQASNPSREVFAKIKVPVNLADYPAGGIDNPKLLEIKAMAGLLTRLGMTVKFEGALGKELTNELNQLNLPSVKVESEHHNKKAAERLARRAKSDLPLTMDETKAPSAVPERHRKAATQHKR